MFAEPAPGALVPAAPWSSNAAAIGITGPAPRLGADNDDVLRELGGCSDDEIRDLERAGAIVAPVAARP